jgi:membrane protease YdiL (CAAX protease family)
MRFLSILFFIVGGVLMIAGLVSASRPSVYPVITVLGSLVLPALFIWWGAILHKKANAKNSERQ